MNIEEAHFALASSLGNSAWFVLAGPDGVTAHNRDGRDGRLLAYTLRHHPRGKPFGALLVFPGHSEAFRVHGASWDQVVTDLTLQALALPATPARPRDDMFDALVKALRAHLVSRGYPASNPVADDDADDNANDDMQF